MRVVFNIVAVVCLAVGLGGILWSGDWRLLLSFPVAFGLGMARNMPRSLHLNPGMDTATSMLGVSISKAERRRKATPAGMLEDIIAAYAKEQHIDAPPLKNHPTQADGNLVQYERSPARRDHLDAGKALRLK